MRHNKAGVENVSHENEEYGEYGKPRLYKLVTMHVVCSYLLICNRLRLHWRRSRRPICHQSISMVSRLFWHVS